MKILNHLILESEIGLKETMTHVKRKTPIIKLNLKLQVYLIIAKDIDIVMLMYILIEYSHNYSLTR